MATRCARCVLSENKPDVWLDERGVCNICAEFEKNNPRGVRPGPLESDFIKTLSRYRGRSKYDCLVMCSGGKDSTMSLYYMKKRYKVNPLAFTFDHGFENEEALRNIRESVNILGVDWLYFKSDFMKDVFAKLVRSGSKAPICHVCVIWYLQATLDAAERYGTPLIVAGWTKGQSVERGETGKEYTSMSEATAAFIRAELRKDPRYKDFPASIKDGLARIRKKFKFEIVSPHWYLDEDPARNREILEKELCWKAPQLSYPRGSTNCIMNFASVYLSIKNFGYTHYHAELSKLIRLGEISREDALKMLEPNFDKDMVAGILRGIGCGLDN